MLLLVQILEGMVLFMVFWRLPEVNASLYFRAPGCHYSLFARLRLCKGAQTGRSIPGANLTFHVFL